MNPDYSITKLVDSFTFPQWNYISNSLSLIVSCKIHGMVMNTLLFKGHILKTQLKKPKRKFQSIQK